ncbi:MAG TPA: hypothetical protein VFH99_02520 [Candidatus Saccharimonadales bacterium]|nr:hypothetical protein [Candidatus Saccharimonadales bacterium]
MSKYVFDKQRWAAMTMFEQMGNIGAEVGRALAAKTSSDKPAMNGALYRGLDLIDYTAQLWATQKSPRTRELLRARELFVESITTGKEDMDLEDYFMQYALAARRHR